MIHTRKFIEYYQNFTITQEMNYKNEGTIYSIIQGEVDSKFIDSVKVKFSYFETLEEARKFIDDFLKEKHE